MDRRVVLKLLTWPTLAAQALSNGEPLRDRDRFAFLLGVSDGKELFGEPTP